MGDARAKGFETTSVSASRRTRTTSGDSAEATLCFTALVSSSVRVTGGICRMRAASAGTSSQSHPHGAAVAHAGHEELPAERRQLLVKGHQRPRTRGKQVSIRVAERLDERQRVGAAVLDQVRERVKAVEQEVRVDLTRQRRQLGAQSLLLQQRRAQPRAVPFGEQEDRLVDVRDQDHDHRHDGENLIASAYGLTPGSPVTCIHTISVSHETGIVSRKIDPSSTAMRRSGVLEPVLAARQPKVQPAVARPDDERAEREVDVRWPAAPTPNAAPGPPGPSKRRDQDAEHRTEPQPDAQIADRPRRRDCHTASLRSAKGTG